MAMRIARIKANTSNDMLEIFICQAGVLQCHLAAKQDNFAPGTPPLSTF